MIDIRDLDPTGEVHRALPQFPPRPYAKITRVRVQDCFNIKDVTLDFTNLQGSCLALFGDNGAGKSKLWLAVLFGLFGPKFEVTSETKVTISGDLKEHPFTIKRSLTSSSLDTSVQMASFGSVRLDRFVETYFGSSRVWTFFQFLGCDGSDPTDLDAFMNEKGLMSSTVAAHALEQFETLGDLFLLGPSVARALSSITPRDIVVNAMVHLQRAVNKYLLALQSRVQFHYKMEEDVVTLSSPYPSRGELSMVRIALMLSAKELGLFPRCNLYVIDDIFLGSAFKDVILQCEKVVGDTDVVIVTRVNHDEETLLPVAFRMSEGSLEK